MPGRITIKARGNPGRQSKTTGRMNQLEHRYAGTLEARLYAGEIASWRFEAHKLRLADNTFYTPDFEVMLPDGTIEFHEVKGFWEEDARVKIKVAAEQFPYYTFRAFSRKHGSDWKEEVF